MKKLLSIALMLICFVSNAQNPVHFRLHSHNEIQDNQEGINYTVTATYNLIKSALTQIKDTVVKYQAKWNMQVESNFIKACLINDNAFSSSTDFLQASDSHSLIEVDPHGHMNLTSGFNYNPNNYADLAHLLDSCGLTPARTNVGGFLYKSTDWTIPASEDWTTWKNGLVGNAYPGYTWTPTTLWGGGTPGHTNDFNAFGVWRPAGTSSVTFGQNASGNLINIGNGCKKWAIDDTTNITALYNYISSYINYCYSAPTTTATFYTASATMNFRGFLNNNGSTIYTPMIDSVSKFLRKMNTLKTAGKIVYENLSETRTNWLALHSVPTESFMIQCVNITLGVSENDLNEKGFGIYPNPATNELNVVKTNNSPIISIYDLKGCLIKSEYTLSDEVKINIKDLTTGIYFIRSGNSYRRFVKD
jgi:hypothetical protein